jgi:indolepyruvate ferredoxin oxidoreductase alpha subunit
MHKLLTSQPGLKMLLLGNEAIARGGLEAGIAVATTYPGTPSSEISLNFFHISRESELYFEYSTNEKVALEVAAAAANSGVRSMCVMKHVGMNVAADVLMTLAYVGVNGGLVIVTADDPFMFSSQNEQDNRYYGKLSGLPMLEPSSAQEAKDMMVDAFDLSEQLQSPVIFRTTTRINHSTEVVALGDLRELKTKGDFEKDPFNYVTVPAVSRNLHDKLLKKLDKAEKISENSEYNTIYGEGEWGIICNGVSFNYVFDAVKDLDIENSVKILRIGFSHPLPRFLIQDFLQTSQKVLMVEEGEPFMEEAVKAFAQEKGLTLSIKGKDDDLFSRLYEYNPALVRECIASYFGVDYTPRTGVDLSDIPEIPQRPPSLCAGCSHRATFYAVQKAAKGMETICPTDIGCYTLGFMPPLSTGDFLICMGSSVGTSCGFSKVTDKKVISFIGDSTFFHTGIPGLINAVFNQHNFTLVILDNGITAMTGHQPHPGVDMEALNLEGYAKVSIEDIVKAAGVKHVSIIRPYQVKKSIETINKALMYKGVSVIISREPCTLFNKALKKPRGKPFFVGEKCKDHRDCINDLACPAFFIKKNRVCIDPVLCSGCSVCAQICPEHAILPLRDKAG